MIRPMARHWLQLSTSPSSSSASKAATAGSMLVMVPKTFLGRCFSANSSSEMGMALEIRATPRLVSSTSGACMHHPHRDNHQGSHGSAQRCGNAHRKVSHTLAKDDVAGPARSTQCGPCHACGVKGVDVMPQRQQQARSLWPVVEPACGPGRKCGGVTRAIPRSGWRDLSGVFTV